MREDEHEDDERPRHQAALQREQRGLRLRLPAPSQRRAEHQDAEEDDDFETMRRIMIDPSVGCSIGASRTPRYPKYLELVDDHERDDDREQRDTFDERGEIYSAAVEMRPAISGWRAIPSTAWSTGVTDADTRADHGEAVDVPIIAQHRRNPCRILLRPGRADRSFETPFGKSFYRTTSRCNRRSSCRPPPVTELRAQRESQGRSLLLVCPLANLPNEYTHQQQNTNACRNATNSSSIMIPVAATTGNGATPTLRT